MLRKQDVELLVSLILVLLGLYILYLSVNIPVRTSFIASSAFIPITVSSLFALLSFILLFKNIKNGGRVSIKRVYHSLLSLYKNEDFKRTLLSIVLVALFLLVGINYLGFYISGAIFMFIVSITFIRKTKIITTLLFSLLYTAALYYLFQEIFMIPSL